jgi:adenylate cyclase
MHKIIYIGTTQTINSESLDAEISQLSGYEVSFHREPDTESALYHFCINDPLVLVILEDTVDGYSEFVQEIKNDELYSYLPIVLILGENTVERRLEHYPLGVDGFLQAGFDPQELVLASHSAIRGKIKLDTVLDQLREVSEENITKAIQLDILRKFIPLTVWAKTESLAENQDFEIAEEEQELSILFADLQSFTTVSESMTPGDVIQLLNGVFHIVTRVIYANHGDIDKFIGDAFLAIFTEPEMALLSAIEIQTEMRVFNEARRSSGEVTTQLRVGIHYGRTIRGSVGGNHRYDNTLIGDTVNTAQRLESQSEPGGLLVSREHLSNISSLCLDGLPFDSYELKGKNTRIDACQFYGYAVDNPDVIEKLRNLRTEDVRPLG